MSATIGTRGKAVHAIKSSKGMSIVTLCGSEFGNSRKGSANAGELHLTDKEVSCSKCAKILVLSVQTYAPQPVKNYGPNARENFAAMRKSAPSAAAEVFWSSKLSLLPV